MIRWRKAESRAKEARKRALDPHMGEVYKQLRKSTRFISIEDVADIYVVALFDKYKNSMSTLYAGRTSHSNKYYRNSVGTAAACSWQSKGKR